MNLSSDFGSGWPSTDTIWGVLGLILFQLPREKKEQRGHNPSRNENLEGSEKRLRQRKNFASNYLMPRRKGRRGDRRVHFVFVREKKSV